MTIKCRTKPYSSKYQILPAGIILSLLTFSLWLGSITASIANRSPTLPAKPIHPTPQPRPSIPQFTLYGKQISLNGRTSPVAWQQWELDKNTGMRTAIADAGLMQLLGVELLNTTDAKKQPVWWFDQSNTTPILDSQHSGYRLLDITHLATQAGWLLLADGDTLRITTPSARVRGIRQGKQKGGDRIVIDLDRPTAWQVTSRAAKPKNPILDDPNSTKSKQPLEWLFTIDATADNATIPEPNSSSIYSLVQAPNLTTIRLNLPVGISPHVSTLANPHRIVIDTTPKATVRDILWAEGLRWRQQFINVENSRFQVVWLEVNPGSGLEIKPISSDANTLVGIAPILKTAQRSWAAAAINGGFFNRKNKLPLGAIRRDGRWLSSPILNRGAIAWNNSGKIKIAQLGWQHNLITSGGQRLPVLSLNSGYVQSGIALYSTLWGASYTPLIDNEVIVVVQNNRVTAQLPGGMAGQTKFPIPINGYLLTLRATNVASALSVGTLISQESATIPADFARYPHILGAGPVLIQNQQIVLNASSEGFSDAFVRQTAVRSAIGTTKSGNLLIAAIHSPGGQAGANLAQTAKIMQQLGCVDALNLDGGSSTSLYLGGQLLDRLPSTAARIHNGLGIFLPRP